MQPNVLRFLFHMAFRAGTWKSIAQECETGISSVFNFNPAMKNRLSFPVRFTLDQEDAIERLAVENRISRAEVVRLAVEQFLAQLKDKGETVVPRVVKASSLTGSGAKARGK